MMSADASRTARVALARRLVPAAALGIAAAVLATDDLRPSRDSDLRAKADVLRSLLLVGAGSLRWPEAPEKIVRFDALVEWTRETPGGWSER